MIRRTLATLSATAIAGLASAAAASPASASSTAAIRLSADTLPGLQALAPLGPSPAGQTISVNVDLNNPAYAAEKALLAAIYTPGSSSYHHFLTPEQVAAEFAAPGSETAAARAWVTRAGLQVQSVNRTGDMIVASGTVAEVERTFSVTIDDYSYKGSPFYANTTAPSVPADLGIFGVDGLNSAQQMHTFDHTPAATARHGATPAQDTCDPSNSVCVGITTPNDLRSVYDAPSENKGQGQSIAIFGEGAFTGPITDLRDFEKLYGLPQIPVKVILTDSADPTKYSDASGDGEWDLDMQSSTGIAPDVQNLDLYFGTSLSDQQVGHMFQVWADDTNGPQQANASFGECEYNPLSDSVLPSTPDDFAAGGTFTLQTEKALTQANLEGRTLFSSAGDTGSSCPVVPVDVNGVGNEAFPDVNYPCASPEAVCVGGTVLYTTGGDSEATPDPTTHASRVLEYSWTYTGGGSSVVFPEPKYQQGQMAVAGQCLYDDTGSPVSGPTACRGVPDVAAQSGDVVSNGYSIYSGGTLGENGGTSLSSPLNVGMWALEEAASNAPKGNGFADPAFYAHAGDFFDVGGGSASPPASDGAFVSTPGWDYLSGLGIPDVTKLMKDLDGGTTPVSVVVPSGGGYTVVTPDGTVVGSSGSSGSTGGGSGPDACAALFTGPPNAAGWPAEAPQPTPQLDILQGDMHVSADGKNLETVLTIQNMQEGATAVPAGGAANEYYMTWSFKSGGTTTNYFTNAEVSAVGTSFSYGTVQKVGASNQFSNSGSVTGKVLDGANGTVEVDVPLSDIGSPVTGDTLTSPTGQTYVEVGAPSVGGSLQPAGSAGPLNDFVLGEICVATGLPGSDGAAAPAGGTVPEAPLAIGVPVLGLAVAGGLIVRRRRRSQVAPS